jgi:hypothetical protein
MPWKSDVLFVACCVAWLVCLPVIIAIGVVGLICYAIVSLITDCFSSPDPQLSNAREMAQRLCSGNDIGRFS